jgi:two-component system response regulator GlrR
MLLARGLVGLLFGHLAATGTGKELVAAVLHRLSSRRSARFEPINCGALSRELLRSELFGHERGAFTGAVERHPGLLREANGGTVFLNEVSELPLDAQAVLLRFLGAGEVRPVGLTRTLHVDVRVITATHRDLTTAIERGTFREDLYYRLREVVLRIPSLRERPEDLPLLVEHCRRRFNERYDLAIDGVTRAALRDLEVYAWPGNVR